jgi:hypothetical protein
MQRPVTAGGFERALCPAEQPVFSTRTYFMNQVRTDKNEPAGSKSLTESLILAQDERWRRA